jgi:hypothetical protein
MSSADASPPTEETTCLNCGEVFRGAYCHACGQRRGGPPLHFHDFVHELVHEFLHFDSKIWRTLKLLIFSPGTLTREYVAGRRVRYVGPVRLFLVSSIVLFGLLAFMKVQVVADGGSNAEARLDEEAAQLEGNRFAQAMVRAAKKGVRDPALLKGAGTRAISKSFFLLVPIFALVMWRLFTKEQPFYVAHMYFALHFHAFAFVLLSVTTALALAGVPPNSIAPTVVALTVPAYFYAALRRAFHASWARTLMTGSLVLFICSMLNMVVIMAFLVGTLLLL